jgi:hypothetical protein
LSPNGNPGRERHEQQDGKKLAGVHENCGMVTRLGPFRVARSLGHQYFAGIAIRLIERKSSAKVIRPQEKPPL